MFGFEQQWFFLHRFHQMLVECSFSPGWTMREDYVRLRFRSRTVCFLLKLPAGCFSDVREERILGVWLGHVSVMDTVSSVLQSLVSPSWTSRPPSAQVTSHHAGIKPCYWVDQGVLCQTKSIYWVSGPDGWKAATVEGLTPEDILFRWSPKHQDLEVISKQSLPTYLYAPGETSSASPVSSSVSSSDRLTICFLSCSADVYLGNKLLSYGQNFSFSLRLDRGVRHPSNNDVILEGGGLRVAASLGDLRSIVPCGKKISYTFRSEIGFSLWMTSLLD